MTCFYEINSASNDGMVNTYTIPNVITCAVDSTLDDLTINFKTSQGTIKQVKEKYSKVIRLSLQK